MNSATQKSYRSLAEHFYSTRLPNQVPDELNIIGALLRAAPEYRIDYFRRLRNALAFDQQQKGNHWLAQEINRTLNPVTVLGMPRKSKPLRAKAISNDDLSALVKALELRHMLAESAALLLIYLTGARPCELFSISVSSRRIDILGAKKSHLGLRGADRTLEASDLVCNAVSLALTALQAETVSLAAMRVAIRETAAAVLARRKKLPSMYTLRHQFGANLKASGMDAKMIAYVMGHQATDSISRYGNKKQGRGECVWVKPAADADLSMVRDTTPRRGQKPSQQHKPPQPIAIDKVGSAKA